MAKNKQRALSGGCNILVHLWCMGTESHHQSSIDDSLSYSLRVYLRVNFEKSLCMSKRLLLLSTFDEINVFWWQAMHGKNSNRQFEGIYQLTSLQGEIGMSPIITMHYRDQLFLKVCQHVLFYSILQKLIFKRYDGMWYLMNDIDLME